MSRAAPRTLNNAIKKSTGETFTDYECASKSGSNTAGWTWIFQRPQDGKRATEGHTNTIWTKWGRRDYSYKWDKDNNAEYTIPSPAHIAVTQSKFDYKPSRSGKITFKASDGEICVVEILQVGK